MPLFNVQRAPANSPTARPQNPTPGRENTQHIVLAYLYLDPSHAFGYIGVHLLSNCILVEGNVEGLSRIALIFA